MNEECHVNSGMFNCKATKGSNSQLELKIACAKTGFRSVLCGGLVGIKIEVEERRWF